MSVFVKTSSDRAANTFPRELIPILCTLIQEISISDQLDSSMLQHEPLDSFLGLQIHHRRLGLFGFFVLIWDCFSGVGLFFVGGFFPS